jgi:hypothetical protein
MQELQAIEDRVNEALLILRSNSCVVTELRLEYVSLTESKIQQKILQEDEHAGICMFDRDLLQIQKDLVMQRSRLEALLQLMADRKSLVRFIVKHENDYTCLPLHRSKTLCNLRTWLAWKA